MKERMLLKESFETAWTTLGFWVREAADAWTSGLKAAHQALPGTLWGQRNDARNLLLRPATWRPRGITSEVWVRNQASPAGGAGRPHLLLSTTDTYDETDQGMPGREVWSLWRAE